MRFRATAYNQAGDTFQFTFDNPNWYGVEAVAGEVLARLVRNNPTHQKHGPWEFRGVDVTA